MFEKIKTFMKKILPVSNNVFISESRLTKKDINQNVNSVKAEQRLIMAKIKRLEEKEEKRYQRLEGLLQEIIWAEVFGDTIKESSWLQNKSFSPGRWAIGYEFL